MDVSSTKEKNHTLTLLLPLNSLNKHPNTRFPFYSTAAAPSVLALLKGTPFVAGSSTAQLLQPEAPRRDRLFYLAGGLVGAGRSGGGGVKGGGGGGSGGDGVQRRHGFFNNEQKCHLNALIQALASCRWLLKDIERCVPTQGIDALPIFSELASLVSRVVAPGNELLNSAVLLQVTDFAQR